MSTPSLPPCDVVIAPNRSVYVNGTLITNVNDLDVNFGTGNPVPLIRLEFVPTSIVYGDVPTSTVEALMFDQHPDDGTVNISRAIARAQARAAGLDPNQHVRPAPTPAAAPMPKRAVYATEDKKVAVAKEAEPMDVEAPEECLYNGTCYRAKGHAGKHY